MGGRFGGSLHPRAESSPRLSSFDASSDSQRFLIHTVPAQDVTAPTTVVVNRTTELKK